MAQTVKQSTYNAGDLGVIPGLGRSPGEGIGTHSSIIATNSWQRDWEPPGNLTMKASGTWLKNFHRIGETDSWRAQTKPFVHQDVGERSSDPTRDWARLACECLGISDGGVGWQWPAMGSGDWLQQSWERRHAGINLFYFSFIFISWRLITLQYCSGFCHTLTWISHGFTSIPHLLHLYIYSPPTPSPPESSGSSQCIPSKCTGPSTCLMHPAWAGYLFHPR